MTRPPQDLAMERYARGDEAAFGELYDAIAPRLYAFLLRQTRSEAAAKDVLQQTMLKIHLARGSFEEGAAVLPWAYAIARRLWIDSMRRVRREAPLDDTREDAADDPSPDEVAYAGELAERVQKELAKLPENQRVAFQLVKQEELSIAEAAAALGATESAVKLRAHRAYLALRTAFGDLLPYKENE
ncbi:MAG TPA: RNA polymerase sigma factor [Polyangiaceae bacterium]|nr:RNA polymerase sigma factor [Polyangiaceae bacterium]